MAAKVRVIPERFDGNQSKLPRHTFFASVKVHASQKTPSTR